MAACKPLETSAFKPRLKVLSSRFLASKAIAAAGIPCTPINSLPEMLAEPQTGAIGILRKVPGLERDVRLIALPEQFDGERPPIRRRAPKIGEHTKEVLGEV